MGKLSKYKEVNLTESGTQLARKLLRKYLLRLQRVCLTALLVIFICKVVKSACVNITNTNLEGWKEEELKRILLN